MKKFEYVVPVEHDDIRDRLGRRAAFVKRSQIEDVYLIGASGRDIVRLRRQDTVTRLSSTRRLDLDGLEENHETIVLDFRASLAMLQSLGFVETDRLKLTRDAWRKNQYSLFLDRIEGMGEFLVLEAEIKGDNERREKRAALKFLRSLGVKTKPAADQPDLSAKRPILAEMLQETAIPA